MDFFNELNELKGVELNKSKALEVDIDKLREERKVMMEFANVSLKGLSKLEQFVGSSSKGNSDFINAVFTVDNLTYAGDHFEVTSKDGSKRKITISFPFKVSAYDTNNGIKFVAYTEFSQQFFETTRNANIPRLTNYVSDNNDDFVHFVSVADSYQEIVHNHVVNFIKGYNKFGIYDSVADKKPDLRNFPKKGNTFDIFKDGLGYVQVDTEYRSEKGSVIAEELGMVQPSSEGSIKIRENLVSILSPGARNIINSELEMIEDLENLADGLTSDNILEGAKCAERYLFGNSFIEDRYRK